ncbi:MAG: S8 family serine peptidase, partial [Alphaproteobacteria bacterium]|nr:S8 family serine peptidase [Alphaproteobacteria bacterium]
MSVCKNILIAFLCGATICAPALANNCDNELYRRYNPDKCISDTKNSGFSLATTATVASGAAALIGGTIALLGLSSGGDNSDASAPAATQVHTTLPTYNHVGGDIDHIHLSSVMGNTEYIRNQNQYNEIRLAYSLARGFTGAGSTIAVLDSGRNTYHGGNVAYLARGQVAPNANVVSYQVSDQYDNFKSFGEISDVINSATTNGTNIYNASWSADIFANQIRNRAQIERLTGTNFINSLTSAANQNDAIFVWAAGNDANSQSSFLSAMPLFVPELNGHFVNVVAWDSATGGLADFSNECGITKNFCITAPGTGLDSPMASAAQQPLDGTSFAAPIVSAAIAVIR